MGHIMVGQSWEVANQIIVKNCTVVENVHNTGKIFGETE